MRIKNLCVLVALSLCAGNAGAVGTFITASSAKDMVYDAQRDVVYISNGSQVLRYKVSTAKFLAPIALGGSLYGIDLSPDGKTLAVADSATTQTALWVHLVDLNTLTDHKHVFTKDPNFSYEAGTWAVAYAATGDLYVTELFAGSGWVPMRKYTAATGLWSAPYSPTQATMVSASGDGKVIAFAESNISDGRWGLVNDVTGELVTRQWYTDGTSWFNYEIAANANATQYFIPTYGGGYVYDKDYKHVKTLGVYAGQQPIGIAYDPVRAIAYMPWEGTSAVRIYDMNTFTQTGTLDFVQQFTSNGNGAYVNGRTRISRDGSLLMVQVAGGVRIDQLYAPLSASNASASTVGGKAVSIPVSGSLGVTGTITYGVATKPAHGTATVSGNTVTFTPDFSFSGTETFKYQAHYGQAVANGTITVAVSPSSNQPPVAVDDYVNLWNTSPAFIDVLSNDSDPERQALSIIAVAQPSAGTVAIQGNKLLYTPPASGYAITNFKYTVSDGHGGTASAQVYVAVRKIR